MEEIFLRDYANNVAQAQDPFGVAAVQAQPGFENYVPSFQNQTLAPQALTPMGMDQAVVPQGGAIDFKSIGKNMAMNTAQKYAVKKLGLKAMEGSALSAMMGFNPFTLSNPIGALYTMNSLLPDGVKGIAEVLRSKRANKVLNKAIKNESQRDTQGDIQTVNLQNRGTPNPYGGGPEGVQSGITSPTTSAPSTSAPSRQSRQTSGPGGLHSGY